MKTAYINGIVYTGKLPLCEAFVVEEGKFGLTGTRDEILKAISDADECVDLHGAFVTPGFNDSHMHLLSYGNTLRCARLAEHTRSLSGMMDYVRDYLRDNPPGEGQWLIGRGWNQDLFQDENRMPSRADLDAVSTEVPILLTRACGHCCVLNTPALKLAGVSAATVSPEGGAIGMEDGEPDGRLYDNAMELAFRVLPSPGKKEIREMLRAACRAVNAYGITSVQTDDYQVFQGVSWETVNEVYREMAESGELTVRVYEQAQHMDVPSLWAFIEAGNITGTGSDMFRIGPLKIVGDGSLGSRTAHLSRPYADDSSTSGFSLFSGEDLNDLIGTAHAAGMQTAVHAIGDACLDRVLDAMERAQKAHPREDPRHGIVHCQITRADQLERMRKLGVHIYAQSIFLDYDNHIVEARAGKELADTSHSWKTLMDSGLSVSNGSDCPVELPDVMEGIECAVTRTSLDGTGPYLPQQAFSVAEALDSFTVHGAEASFEEKIKGRIAPGYLADFTVLKQNPFNVPPRDLHAVAISACYLGGRCVYRAGQP